MKPNIGLDKEATSNPKVSPESVDKSQKEFIEQDAAFKRDEQFLKINKRIQETVVMVWKLLEKRQSRLVTHLEKFPSLCYSSAEASLIRRSLFQLKERLSSFSQKTDFNLGRSSLNHILGNGPYSIFTRAEREAQKTEFYEFKVEETKKIIGPQDDTKRDFEKIVEVWKLNKNIWDAFLYYIDYIGKKENSEAFEMEITTDNGYLERFRKYYINGKLPISSGRLLEHFNFFTRLNSEDSSGPIRQIKSIDKISCPITRKNFDREFEKLLYGEDLDKQAIYKDFFEGQRAMAA